MYTVTLIALKAVNAQAKPNDAVNLIGINGPR
jgi:hypothetical protein